MFKGIPTVGGRGCIAGISYCSILPNGDVHICPYTHIKVDSIRERDFDDICGGCRARAFSATGDWLEADPYCLLDV